MSPLLIKPRSTITQAPPCPKAEPAVTGIRIMLYPHVLSMHAIPPSFRGRGMRVETSHDVSANLVLTRVARGSSGSVAAPVPKSVQHTTQRRPRNHGASAADQVATEVGAEHEHEPLRARPAYLGPFVTCVLTYQLLSSTMPTSLTPQIRRDHQCRSATR